VTWTLPTLLGEPFGRPAVEGAVEGAALVAAQAESDQLGGIAGWAVSLMESLGGPGAGLAIAIENLFPPLPSEVILPLAGFTASRGELSLVEALIWTTVGSVVGAVVLYGLGAALGLDRTRALAERMPLLKGSDVDHASEWLSRHGKKAVFFGRMIPVFRSFISIPAGVNRMPITQFVLLTALGSGIWNTAFVLAGFTLGENWARVEPYAGTFQTAVIAIIIIVIAYAVVKRVRELRHQRDDG
jgi:membrane protein DedA with SNARE-associated domain